MAEVEENIQDYLLVGDSCIWHMSHYTVFCHLRGICPTPKPDICAKSRLLRNEVFIASWVDSEIHLAVSCSIHSSNSHQPEHYVFVVAFFPPSAPSADVTCPFDPAVLSEFSITRRSNFAFLRLTQERLGFHSFSQAEHPSEVRSFPITIATFRASICNIMPGMLPFECKACGSAA